MFSRQRGDRWEFKLQRKGVLPKPVWLSFPTKEEGEAYCARLERLLDSGVVPEELQDRTGTLTTISLAYEHYQRLSPVSDADQGNYPILLKRIGHTRLSAVDYKWVEGFVERCKDEWSLSPSTIRHHSGSLSRLWDWLLKRQAVPTNPFRALRRGYAGKDEGARWRRLEKAEEEALKAHLTGELRILFLLALETAMRMREMYTLTADQVDLPRRTIFLDKTKNGDKRQVPLSTVAVSLLGTIVTQSGTIFPGLRGKKGVKQATSRISIAFARACKAAGVTGLRFHDLRHEATCRLYERTRLTDVQISLITGHKDLRMLRRYANLRASTLAESLW